MSQVDFTEVSEFGQALLSELTKGGTHAEALINYLKGEVVCDFSTYQQLLNSDSLRAAAAELREKASPSTYRRRLTARVYVNADTLSNSRAKVKLQGVDSVSANLVASLPVPFAVKEGNYQDLFTTPEGESFTTMTVTTGGAYRLSFNALLVGLSDAGAQEHSVPTAATHRFFPAAFTDTNKRCPIDVILEIDSGGSKRYQTLATSGLYVSDCANARSVTAAGTALLRLANNTKLRLILQRGPRLGTFQYLSTSAMQMEALGFLKSTTIVSGSSSPTRDGCNYLEITRLT